ncbi:MAG: hypothetical protein ACOCT0_00080 [Halobacteriota archaeon]
MNRSYIAVALLLGLAATAGCLDSFEDTDTLDYVPDDSDAVFQLDMEVLEDPVTENLGEEMIELESERAGDDYDGPEDYEESLEEIQNDTDLDPRGIDEVTGFGELDSDDEAGGVVMSAAWTEDELVEQMEENASVEETEHAGRTVYNVTPDDSMQDPFYLAALDDGVYSMATRPRSTPPQTSPPGKPMRCPAICSKR